jgi:hypothetical protein
MCVKALFQTESYTIKPRNYKQHIKFQPFFENKSKPNLIYTFKQLHK